MANQVIGQASLDISEVEKKLDIIISKLDQFNQHAEKASKGLQQTSVSMKALNSVLGSLGIGFGLSQIVAFGKSLLKFGQDTKNSAELAQESTGDFQRLKAELQQFVDTDTATTAIQTFSSALRDAKNDNGDAQASFVNLGVSIEKLKDPATHAKELIEELANQYNKAADKQEFMRKGTVEFGADFLKLEPVFKAGGQQLKDIGDQAQVAGDNLIDAAASGERAWEKFGDTIKKTALIAFGAWSDFFEKWGYGKGPDALGASYVNKDHSVTNPDGSVDRNPLLLLRPHEKANSPTNIRHITQPKKPSSGDASPKSVSENPANPANSTETKPIESGSELHASQSVLAAEKDLNATYQSQLAVINAQIAATQERLGLIANSGIKEQAQLKATLASQELQRSNLQFQVELQSRQAAMQTSALRAQIDGNTHLADIESIRAQYAERIAQANRDGKTDLERQLTLQKNLAVLQTEIPYYSMTPAERFSEHERQRIAHRAAVRAKHAADDYAHDGSYRGGFGTHAYGYRNSRGPITFKTTGTPTNDATFGNVTVQNFTTSSLAPSK